MESAADTAKKRIVKVVTQTQVGCAKQVCLADLCFKNPGTLV